MGELCPPGLLQLLLRHTLHGKEAERKGAEGGEGVLLLCVHLIIGLIEEFLCHILLRCRPFQKSGNSKFPDAVLCWP